MFMTRKKMKKADGIQVVQKPLQVHEKYIQVKHFLQLLEITKRNKIITKKYSVPLIIIIIWKMLQMNMVNSQNIGLLKIRITL